MSRLWRDRYEPLEVVGRGGQGEVLRAHDHLHGTTVALKVRDAGAGDRERIIDEARILRSLRPHPGVTLVREDFFEADRYVMVMDWVNGPSLASLVAREGDPGLPRERVAALIAQAADALEHMHAHDPPVVHGDVKPANLVLAGEERLVLVDFGTAAAGTIEPRLGASRFTAPEVARGEPLSPAADVYSLAATAFALLTGTPFELGVPPAFPGLARDEARRLRRALEGALHPDPRRRPRASALAAGIAPPAPPAGNLPAPSSGIVGRAGEIRRIRARLRTARLITLAGPGGVGKTTLALAVARASSEAFPSGAWLAGLATLRDPSLVEEQVARAIGAPGDHRRTAAERIARALEPRAALLVLDNAEHVVEAAASAAEAILSASPNTRIVVTSREPLGVRGEAIVRVAPLPVTRPGPGAGDAVRLFRDRARAADPRFRLTASVAPVVEEICRRLDGLPLAIELAAARVGALEPAEIAARLDARFGLLASKGATLPHHRTLRAAIEWSEDLLTAEERTLLAAVAVFAGTFTLEAATEVCGGGGDVAAVLARLVDRSLVMRGDGGGYRLLETVRDLAGERLEASSAAPAVRRAHLARLLRIAGSAPPGPAGAGDADRLDTLSGMLDDARDALAWALGSGGDPHGALRLACALTHLWLVRGDLREGRAWIDRALQAGVTDDALRAEGLNAAGNLARGAGDYANAERALLAARALRANAGDRAGVARASNGLGVVAMDRGDNERARGLFQEAARIGRELGDPALVEGPIGNLGILALAAGDHDGARAFHEESLALARERGDEIGTAYSLQNIAIVEQARGRHESALVTFRESLAVLQRLGDRRASAECVLQVGEIALESGDPAEAARLFACADRALEDLGSPLPEYARPEFDRVVGVARERAGREPFDAAWRAGREASLEEIVRAIVDGDSPALARSRGQTAPEPA